MQIPVTEKTRLNQVMAGLKHERFAFWSLWKDVANYFLPKRYIWLESGAEQRAKEAKNPYILDSTGTLAARVLASGMMNGVTSPSRPWLKLRVKSGIGDPEVLERWADEVTRRMMQVMAESNFYNALAVLYLDLVVFGSASMLIYEDSESIIRCYNPALGEFYFSQNDRLTVDTFAREFKQTAKQLAARFGEENLPQNIRVAAKKHDASSLNLYKVYHLVEPNYPQSGVPEKFRFIETYWCEGGQDAEVLGRGGFNELPGIFPRWELAGNDSYGTSPCMAALPDVIQLQHETKRKAQALDKMVNPPMIADIQLEHRPAALMPNGITYVAGLSNNVGMRPAYQVSAPLQEMTMDIRDIQTRIQETLHNNLFNMISQLDSVRTATEIDARREEKLVLLGSVLERFENEALDPSVERIFGIMDRQGLLPDLPEGTEIEDIEIQYVSILSVAQRAVGAAPTERFLQLLGQVGSAYPPAFGLPDWENLLRNYGRDIGMRSDNVKLPERVAEEQAAAAAAAQQERLVQDASQMANAAQGLSETDVGGGANALQMLLAQS